MDEKLVEAQKQINTAIENFSTIVLEVLDLLEKRKQTLLDEVHDKAQLDAREADIKAREEEMSLKDKEHEQRVKDDAERKKLLDIKERQMTAEKQRFQTLIDTL